MTRTRTMLMITNKTRRMIRSTMIPLRMLLLLLLILVLAADTIPILSATAAALETDADAAVSDSSAGSSTINTTIVTMTTDMGNPYDFNSHTNSFLVNSRRLLNQKKKKTNTNGTHDTTTQKPPPENDWFFPLLLSCLAGASTCAGAAVVFCVPASTIRHAMAGSLSFAASVMITVSIVSILPEVMTGLVEYRTTTPNDTNTDTAYPILHTDLLVERSIAFGVGVLAYVLLAKLLQCLPEPDTLYLLDEAAVVKGQEDDDVKRQYDLYLSEEEEDPGTATIRTTRKRRGAGILSSSSSSSSPSTEEAEADGDEDLTAFSKARRKRSWRVALMLFTSLLLHNFPEGLCVAASAKESPELGIRVAIGIFIHNVPEGIAISVPCMAARPDQPWFAFWLASASGLAEPIGAWVALVLLQTTSTTGSTSTSSSSSSSLDLENVLAFVAGVMIAVSFWELYPEALHSLVEAHTPYTHQKFRQQYQRYPQLRVAQQLTYQYQYYRPILGGTLLGAVLMIATELYI